MLAGTSASAPGVLAPAGEGPRKVAASRITSMEDFEQLLESFEQQNQAAEGEVLKGTVLKIDGDDVVVDVGQKSEGTVRLREFLDANGVAQVHPGDIIDVVIERDTGERGLRLSHEKAARLRLWDELEQAHEQGTIIQGRIVERIKGGLACDIGVKAFLPGSQLDAIESHLEIMKSQVVFAECPPTTAFSQEKRLVEELSDIPFETTEHSSLSEDSD